MRDRPNRHVLFGKKQQPLLVGLRKSYVDAFINARQRARVSPAFLSAEVGLLDPPPAPEEVRLKPDTTYDNEGNKSKRARKGQRDSNDSESATEVPSFVKGFGSSGWIRTSNPPVNSRMLYR